MKNNFRIVFVHGYTASHLTDWYPAISPMLDELGYEYYVPDLLGGEHPHVEEWLETLHEVIVKSDKPLILVGHSLGTRAVLLYLEKYKLKVEKVFLIAAFSNELKNAERRDGEAYPDFFTKKVDIDSIKKLVKQFFVLHSRDDHSIPYKQGIEIARELDAKLLTYENRDHFSKSENAEEIFNVLKREIAE